MTLMDVEIRPEDFLPESRAISNSEVTSYLSCKRQYNFAFIDVLAPKEEGRQLTRGTLGHAYMQWYIEARLNSSDHDLSMKKADEVFIQAMKDGTKPDIVMETQTLCQRYMAAHNGFPEWEFLGTEQRLDLRITDTLIFPIRYDVYVMEKSNGKRRIGDFKFTYDFWSYEDHALNGQLPKYMTVMRANGFQVDSAFLEQIRTRKITDPVKLRSPKNNLWVRSDYYPSNANLANTLRQHVAASLEIERHRALDPKTREDESIPVLNKFGACKYCNFKPLCIAKLEGKRDLTVDIRSGYTTNTYGYNKENEEF